MQEAYIGFKYLNFYIALIFSFLNAYAPVIFTVFWSLIMVVKEQGEDEKVRLMIMDISSKLNS
jgi:hypothetical protein